MCHLNKVPTDRFSLLHPKCQVFCLQSYNCWKSSFFATVWKICCVKSLCRYKSQNCTYIDFFSTYFHHTTVWEMVETSLCWSRDSQEGGSIPKELYVDIIHLVSRPVSFVGCGSQFTAKKVWWLCYIGKHLQRIV